MDNSIKHNLRTQNDLINRVPQIVLLYWIIKIAATTLGETGADLFSMTMDIGYFSTIVIFSALFFSLLALKIQNKKYDPILYWLVFTASAILGTALSDFIDRTLGLGYLYGSLMLITLLIISLAIWYSIEKSIDVEGIFTSKAEIFYWISFLIANTLGTAIGDFLADELEIGFLTSAVGIGVVLIIVALMHYFTKISSVILFWIAFVLTRPFGATFGDLLTKSPEDGGLGYGTVVASSFFLIALIISLGFEKNRLNKGSCNIQ